MRRSIPGNPLYRPGGQPELPLGGDAQPVEPLGASTIAQSVLPSPSQFGEIAMATAVTAPPEGADVDIDLDLDVDLDLDSACHRRPRLRADAGGHAADAGAGEPSICCSTHAVACGSRTEPRGTEARPALDFDLAASRSTSTHRPPHRRAAAGRRRQRGASNWATRIDEGSDPFERKLELAEEFRQIGDTDGARDLLQEVIAQTAGAIQAKAATCSTA